MRYQPESHASAPFPWIGIVWGVALGLVIAIAAPWCIFSLKDTNIMRTR